MIAMQGVREPKQFARGTQEMEPLHDDLAGIVHDLKNPLAAIELDASLLELLVADGPVRQSLERIHRNVAFMDRLIHDLLDAATMTHRPMMLRSERIDLVELARGVVERVAPPARERVVVSSRGDTFVYADGPRIERVLANLIDNALRYSDSEQHVLVRISGAQSRVAVSVIDRGPGLSDADARRAFGMFERVRVGNTPPGHGVGLAVAKHIVEAHGGLIGVDSALGRGARFFFELPGA
jgi:two-component system phosphate regulon sensor histidine kinase PhoR